MEKSGGKPEARMTQWVVCTREYLLIVSFEDKSNEALLRLLIWMTVICSLLLTSRVNKQ